MKYMLLIYGDEQQLPEPGSAALAEEGAKYEVFTKSIVGRIRLGYYQQTVDAVSAQLCKYALVATGGNLRKAAILIGVSRTQFYRMMDLGGLDGGD